MPFWGGCCTALVGIVAYSSVRVAYREIVGGMAKEYEPNDGEAHEEPPEVSDDPGPGAAPSTAIIVAAAHPFDRLIVFVLCSLTL